MTTTGIVTATRTNGFYLHDPVGDGNIATSDAIFVFTRSALTVNVGDEVEVAGTVSEFTSGGASTNNLSITQISRSPSIRRLSTGNALPAPVILGSRARIPPSCVINDHAFASFDPTLDSIDFFESLESMRVTAPATVAVSPSTRLNKTFVVGDNGARATGLSFRGTLNISPQDFNPEKFQIQIDNSILPGFPVPSVNVGDRLGDVTGVVTYSFGNFEIRPTELFSVTPGGLRPEYSRLSASFTDALVASVNALNLDPGDVNQGRFNALAKIIVNDLGCPDIIGLQEIQDNNGPQSSNDMSADVTLGTLVDAIRAVGGVWYEFVDNEFIGVNTSGGQRGGNIRTAFLYNPRRFELDPQSLSPIVDPVDQQTKPTNPFCRSRLPLAASFRFLPTGCVLHVVNNHFSSQGGSASIFGRLQNFDERQNDT